MLGLGKGSLKLRVKHVKKESKCDGSPLGPATFEIGKNNRACYVENVLLADDPQLQEALGKSKNLLEKSASEVKDRAIWKNGDAGIFIDAFRAGDH